MADTLIKGLEMPDSCYNCKFGMWDNYEQAYVCDAVNPFGSIVFFDGFKSDLVSIVKSRRADNCPLVPVPSHGSSGDLDALIERIEFEVQHYVAKDEFNKGRVAGWKDIIRAIREYSSAIIPASEGDE